AVLQSNHPNQQKSYRIAGKWDGKNTTLAVVNPGGKQITLTDRIIDLGEDEEKAGPKGPKGFYLASYIPNDEGLYQGGARRGGGVGGTKPSTRGWAEAHDGEDR